MKVERGDILYYLNCQRRIVRLKCLKGQKDDDQLRLHEKGYGHIYVPVNRLYFKRAHAVKAGKLEKELHDLRAKDIVYLVGKRTRKGA